MSKTSGITSLALALVFASGVARAAEVTPPADIAKAGKIAYCAEFGNPPLGFYDENQVLGGLDVDIGTEIASRMGVKAEWKDCLLYTSPSPRDGLLSRMPSSA